MVILYVHIKKINFDQTESEMTQDGEVVYINFSIMFTLYFPLKYIDCPGHHDVYFNIPYDIYMHILKIKYDT